MERPQNGKRNRRMYSGKKNTHTRKHVVMSDEKKRIRVLSPAKPGRRYDKRMMDARFIVKRIPKDIHLWRDSAFKGINKIRVNTHAVKYGTKKRPLTQTERDENTFISEFRIVVEHAIGGMKRYHVMSDVLGNKIGMFDDRVAGVCAGLWNWHLNYAKA